MSNIKKIGTILLIAFMIITSSINIVTISKTNKLLGTIPSRNIDSNEVEYTSEKTVQGAINDLAEKANIIGTDEEKNKFRDDSKTLIGQIGTDKLNTTSQNISGAVNEINTKINNMDLTPYSFTNVSMTTGYCVPLKSFTLDPGTYLIIASAQMETNSTGYRRLYLGVSATNCSESLNTNFASTANPVASVAQQLNISGLYENDTKKTLYLKGYQNSGNSYMTNGIVQIYKLP